MSRAIVGPLLYPDGTAIGAASVRFVATRNAWQEGLLPSTTLLPSATLIPTGDDYTPRFSNATATTDSDGAFWLRINLGQYRVLLQESGETAWSILGNAKVEAGGTIELGELIEFTETDLETTYADIATQTWVEATYSAGTPSSVDITDVALGTATAYQHIRIDPTGHRVMGRAPERALQYYFAHCAGHLEHRITG